MGRVYKAVSAGFKVSAIGEQACMVSICQRMTCVPKLSVHCLRKPGTDIEEPTGFGFFIHEIGTIRR